VAVDTFDNVKQAVTGGIRQSESILDPLAEPLQNAISALIEAGGQPARNVKTFLNGTWLGHPLHPVLTDIPIGAWTTALALDVMGFRKAADAAVGMGILGAVPTALAGLADWHDTQGQPRKVGMAHATFNSLALTSYVGSWFARKNGSRGLGVGLSTVGFMLTMCGAYLGGEIVYKLGTIVDRTAFDPETDEWRVAAKVDDLVEGQLHGGEVTIDGVQVPIVLLKRGETIHALHGRCAHMGGPLAEGKIVDRTCVECPWHGSTFDMRDGTVVQGPSAFNQPYYVTRVQGANVEVRLAPDSAKHS
jgi:nitrite reductase/ring-hydroxylating ferredoxin subunit/uncharacterized membrane protein